MGDGIIHRCSIWRVRQVGSAIEDDGAVMATGNDCWICGSPTILGAWPLGTNCTGEPHIMCEYCTNTWLWSHFQPVKKQPKCSFCNMTVDLDNVIPARSYASSWHEAMGSTTTKGLTQVITELKEELQRQQANEAEALRALAECPVTDHPIGYCGV